MVQRPETRGSGGKIGKEDVMVAGSFGPVILRRWPHDML